MSLRPRLARPQNASGKSRERGSPAQSLALLSALLHAGEACSWLQHCAACVRADEALASALAALGLGDDALATLRALPDPLALRILERLDAPDLDRCARLAQRALLRGGCLTLSVMHAYV